MSTVIHIFIKFCMVANPTMCSILEIAPLDQTVTMPLCMRGTMMGNQEQFKDEQGIVWQIKGGYCKHVPNTLVETQARLKGTVRP